MGASNSAGPDEARPAAVAARAVEAGSASGVDPVLLLRVLRQWRYAAGLALDALGFLLQVAASRSLPLYAVGASLAASLAVTAVVAPGFSRSD